MECDFTEKVSRLVDGELSGEEAAVARAHLSGCAACRSAREDFLTLRERVKSYPYSPDPAGRRRALRRILGSDRPPLWRRSVRLPAPAFALMLAALVVLGAWAALVRRDGGKAAPEAGPVPGKVVTPQAGARGGGMDLARFDRGERAALYKVKRAGAERGQ